MYKIFTVYIVVLIFILFSCEKDESLRPESVNRTVIIYMSADNDLSADALDDIEEMKKGYRDNGIHLVVFADLARESPYLLEMAPDSGKIVKTYPEINSANASQMQEVLNDIVDLYPAHNYGLILWSHGTSWLPSNMPLRSFGRDHGSEMDIPDLSMALPIHFDFILFDACLMGAVEVAYELKDKTDYLIASSMEIIYKGFPYDKVIPELVKPVIDYKSVARHYFDYYDTMQGAYRSATVSVIETRYLQELAHRLKQLFENNTTSIHPFDRTSVQGMDTYQEQYCFDLADFVDTVFPETDKSLFTDQLNKAVVYKAHTPMFLSEYEIKTYCGLSCYIPHPSREDLNNYYKTLQWCKDSGMDKNDFYPTN
jgi:Clostripain family.